MVYCEKEKYMRIGINASFLRKPATGIGQVTQHFLETLFTVQERDGHTDREFILYTEEKINEPLPEYVRNVVCMPHYKRDDLIRKVLWEKYLLPRQVRKDHCDVFLSLYQCPTVMPTGIRHVMLIHDVIPKIFPQYRSNIRKKLYQKMIDHAVPRADHIMTVSAHTQKDVQRFYDVPREKVSVNYISVDPRFAQEVTAQQARKVMKKYHLTPGYIYSGGGLEVRKNVAQTLQAYAQLLQQDTTVEMPDLVISGKYLSTLVPMITDVEKAASELGIAHRVHFIGFVAQDDLPALYQQATLFVFPSLYEGFGMPVLEAMSVGTPVITTHLSSLPEVGGSDVAYCGEGSVEELADAIRRLLENPQQRQRYAIAGKKRATAFSWQTFTQQTLERLL